ncbi:MAG: hypothetical protein U5K54_04095 [Cytophagales bacterium]|nr:hypothetical protein [Cytophagales bacterium]
MQVFEANPHAGGKIMAFRTEGF